MSIKRTVLTISVLVTGLVVAGFAIAQSMHHGKGMHEQMHGHMKGGMHGNMQGPNYHGHQGHGSGGIQGDQSASSIAFYAVNEKMHRDMAITFSGDTDADFARAMIPHHQGAVDMAKIVLVFGKDPGIKKLAESIVKSQEAEIAFMSEWLKKKGE